MACRLVGAKPLSDLTNAEIFLIWSLGTKFREILIENHTFSFKQMHLKMSSAKWQPFHLGLNVLIKQLSCRRHDMELFSALLTLYAIPKGPSVVVLFPNNKIHLKIAGVLN